VAATRGTLEHRLVRLSWGGALTIVATIVSLIVLRGVFVAAHRPLSWALAAAVAAVLLDPVVDRLARHIRRVPAVLLTFLALGAVGVGTTYLVFDEVQQALDRLETAAPEAAADVEARDDRLGEIARDANLGERVDSFVTVLQERVTGRDDVLRTTAGTAPTYLVSAILTVFLMTYGPRMATAAVKQDPDEARARRTALIVGAAVARARRAVVLTVCLAAALGLAGTAVALWLDLPAPSAVGVSIAVAALFPPVGLLAGSVPLLLLTLGFRSGVTALVLLGVVLVLQAVDSVVVRGQIARRSVHFGLLVPWVVALLGYSVYGVGGAAYGVMLAVFGVAVLDRLEAANEARTATSAADS
jgi:predicted PurR-regulated permease PerM